MPNLEPFSFVIDRILSITATKLKIECAKHLRWALTDGILFNSETFEVATIRSWRAWPFSKTVKLKLERGFGGTMPTRWDKGDKIHLMPPGPGEMCPALKTLNSEREQLRISQNSA